MRLPSFEILAPGKGLLLRPLTLHEAPPSCPQPWLGCQPPRHLFTAALPSPGDQLSALININGRVGSRGALPGDSLSGRCVRAPSRSCNGTPQPDSQSLASSHPTALGGEPGALGEHPETSSVCFPLTAELVTPEAKPRGPVEDTQSGRRT